MNIDLRSGWLNNKYNSRIAGFFIMVLKFFDFLSYSKCHVRYF